MQGTRLRTLTAALLSSVAIFKVPASADPLPTGGTVTQGAATIGASGANSLVVTQSSSNAIINWSSFSIGQNYQVQFNNGAGATLNRVTGNVPSSIDGTLTATGSVYLVNPAGIVVGPTGVIKTGGSFVGSALDIQDANFLNGGEQTFGGTSKASVVNLGKIGSSHGDVVLIARQVQNDGTLSARNGTAAMASGSEVVISDGSLGNGKVSVRLPAQDGLVLNRGAIRAAEVELRANGGNVYALAGNTGGVVKATGVSRKGSRIFLTAEGGSVVATQKLVARRVTSPSATTTKAGRSFSGGDIVIEGDSVTVGGLVVARGRDGSGGTVVITGGDVHLTSSAAIDASGTSGGTVLIGGDRGGGADASLKFLDRPVASAQTTTIDAGATVLADGTSGAGGQVVVWSNGLTSFAGTISATGVGGGFVETSGHALAVTGRVDAGKGGNWLLDPYDLVVDATLAASISAALNAGTDVTEQTTVSGSGGSGDITVTSAIGWSGNAKLTLNAYRNITIAAPVTLDSGTLALNAGTSGNGSGAVAINSTVSITGAGSVVINAQPIATISSTGLTFAQGASIDYGTTNKGGTFSLNGQSYTLLYGMSDVEAVNNNLAGNYALATSLDASGRTYTTGV
ncbi:filamentous hemagglutinin N-terminal domain-containing protein, partial [Bradyrhizobium sp. HKCCYLS20291]|uniref:two-partner secretion domain-containing protein n=1 Tax=Bradyrhizobium sp. HKCCYLS20291 TaxID=3420766 RepID=UPI003EBE9C8F